MKFLYGFSIDVIDNHPESPAYLTINNDWIGSLKMKYYSDDNLMEIIHKVWEVGIQQGKTQKAKELRDILDL